LASFVREHFLKPLECCVRGQVPSGPIKKSGYRKRSKTDEVKKQ